MTLEKLARMTHGEFLAVRKETTKGFAAVRKEMSGEFAAAREEMATKNWVYENFATKADLEEFKDEVVETVKKENVKTLQANDKVIAKLDLLLKDKAGHDALHIRLDDTIVDHGTRISVLEKRAPVEHG